MKMNSPDGNTDMDKICSGCFTHERYIKERFGTSIVFYGECTGYIKKDIDCPCQLCLVKIMCNSACGELRKTRWYIENRKEAQDNVKNKMKRIGA